MQTYKPFSKNTPKQEHTTEYGTINPRTKSYFIQTNTPHITIPNHIIDQALNHFLDTITLNYKNTIKQIKLKELTKNLDDNGHYTVTI